jgi:hypothetical protein
LASTELFTEKIARCKNHPNCCKIVKKFKIYPSFWISFQEFVYSKAHSKENKKVLLVGIRKRGAKLRLQQMLCYTAGVNFGLLNSF